MGEQKEDTAADLEQYRQAAMQLQGQLGEESTEDARELLAKTSRIVLPPPLVVAPARSDGNFIPAKDGDDLVTVGGLRGWWDQEGHWNDGDLLEVFANEETMDYTVREVLLRQAVVECLAVLGQQGEEMLTAGWEAGMATVRNAAAIGLVLEDSGDVTLKGDLDALLQGLSPQVDGEIPAPMTDIGEQNERANFLPTDQAQQILDRDSEDPAWRKVSLANPKFKFAVRKRFYQLSGNYLADAKLLAVDTAGQLLQVVLTPLKPKRLVDELAQKEDLLSLPNVKVFNRRVTPIDKEIWQGRWKVIADELKERGLPVTGKGKYDKAAEPRWNKGEYWRGRRRPSV